MADAEDISVGDFYEGVVLETCRDENRELWRHLTHFPGCQLRLCRRIMKFILLQQEFCAICKVSR